MGGTYACIISSAYVLHDTGNLNNNQFAYGGFNRLYYPPLQGQSLNIKEVWLWILMFALNAVVKLSW